MSSKRTRRAPAPEVQVTVRGGEVPVDSRDYAADKIGHLADYSTRPVLYAHVVLEVVGDPARTRPALAEATLDVNGAPLRAHVAAADTHEAVDLLEGRLRRQLMQLEGRVQNRHHRTGVAGDHEWRHGDLPQGRPEYRDRPVEERTVVRHKMLALEATTPDEAVADMEQVGHDFFLFTDRSSGQDAVVYRLPAGGYGGQTAGGASLHLETSNPGTSPAGTPRARLPEGARAAAPMTEEQAVEHLDLAGAPFVFHLDPGTGRGRVLYRRYDGHYGLITAG
jgi:ribosomal subunit interface protein